MKTNATILLTISILITPLVFGQPSTNPNADIRVRPSQTNWWTGNVQKSVGLVYTDNDGQIRAGNNLALTIWRGYATFNISQIPNNAVIQSVSLTINVSTASTSTNHVLDVKKLTVDPRSTGGQTLYDNIGAGGNLYAGAGWGAMRQTGWQTRALASVAVTDLQAKVSAGTGWWAIGFQEDGDNDNNGIADGWNVSTMLYCDITYALAPTATTLAPNIYSYSAELLGTVNPNGLSTTAYFQWGTTTSYGNTTTPQSVGSGTTDVNISQIITGLSANASYHYRIVANNSAGTTYGADRLFTTFPAPPSLQGPTIGAFAGGTCVTFGWSSAPGATSYYIQISRNQSFSPIYYQGPVSSTINNICPPFPNDGSQFYWRVRSCRSDGCGDYNSPPTPYWFINSFAPPPSLVSPANNSNVGGGTVTFVWQPVSSALEYWIQVSRNSGFTDPIFFNGSAGTNTSFPIPNFQPSSQYWWRVRTRSSEGWGNYNTTPWSFNHTTSVDGDKSRLPRSFALEQNYPNPFNPGTNIQFDLPQGGHALLKIYNTLGEEVATLVDDQLPPGTHRTEWNASGFASGVYFYRLRVGDFVATRKLVLLK